MGSDAILVAYASKRGGTAELAHWLGEELRDLGYAVHVRPAREVHDLDLYDVVVLGGSLYANRWHRDAVRLARRIQRHGVPEVVYCFSSGPLDASAIDHDIPPTHQVRSLMDRLGAIGHSTFGGRLLQHPGGFVAEKMAANGHAGDWRSHDQVRAVAHEIDSALRTMADEAEHRLLRH